MSRLTSNVRCKPPGLARWFDLVVISCIARLAEAIFLCSFISLRSVRLSMTHPGFLQHYVFLHSPLQGGEEVLVLIRTSAIF